MENINFYFSIVDYGTVDGGYDTVEGAIERIVQNIKKYSHHSIVEFKIFWQNLGE